ncbi:hypothetical protein Tco_0510287, partial [Tanacetum coccineum]
EDLQQIHPDDMEKMDLRWQMAMLTMRARSPKWSATTATRGDILLGSVEQRSKISRQQEQGELKKECACGNIYFHIFGVM